MERILFVVRAAPGGWSVSAEALACPLMFLSGARAERQACRLAQAAAIAGHSAAVVVHDRSERLIALIEVAPAAIASGPASWPPPTSAPALSRPTFMPASAKEPGPGREPARRREPAMAG